MIKENEPFVFVVTHVEIEGQYLKIWAQTDEMVVQSVNKILLSLREKFDYCQSNVPLPSNVTTHTHCCARGINNDFCRAKILNLRSDGMVLVQFVDYGNVSHVPIHNIRLLDNLAGAEYLFSVPYAATCFILADVMPIGGAWLQDVVKQIRSFLINYSFQGVYREVNDCKILKFTMMSEDFGTLLVNRNMALFSSPCANNPQPLQTPPLAAHSVRMPRQVREPIQENWRVPTVQQAPPPKMIKTNSFKAIQLEIGSVHDVQVSYVDEGPCKFSIQLLEAIPYLEAMMQSINSKPHIALQESPIAGTVCLGQQTHPKRLCRVVLNSPGDTSCKVYYADYGHHEVLPFSSLYQIPDEFVVPNIFSIRFTLNGISGWNVSQEMKDYFGGLVANKNLKLRVCKGPLSPLTQYCDLYLNGKSIRDILCEVFPEACELSYPEPKQLKIGAKETVMVPFVESIAKFFVQIESNEKLLDSIMEQVEQVSKTAPMLTHGLMRKDMPCIALYDDQKWYRASILEFIDDVRVLVSYVDYGNEEIVSLNNLRAIPPQLIHSLPKQAIRCCLSGYQFEPANPDITKKFENLVLEERMILVAVDVVNGTYIVNLHDVKHINDAVGDITKKMKIMNLSQSSTVDIRNQESSLKYPIQNQRSDEKSQLVQKPRVRNKNLKSRDNWTGAGNLSKNEDHGMIPKVNSFESHDNFKAKFRKDTENEQRHDNRNRRDPSDYPTGTHSNRFTKDERKIDKFDQHDKYGKDYPVNDQFVRSSDRDSFESTRIGKENQTNRSSVNARLDRSYGSDRDSDSSSKNSGKRNTNRNGRQPDDQRIRDSPPNRNRMGKWDNDQQINTSRIGSSNQKTSDINKAKSPKESRTSQLDTAKSSESKVALPTSIQIPPPNITAGAVKNCIMVFYNSPSSFYVQLCPDNEELNLVMDKIFSVYQNGGKVIPPSHIKDGLYCVAQWKEDNQWYRAVVKSIAGSVATVHFIDYGNLEKVSFDKIKEIQPELAKLSTQAIHCKLFCPPKSDWTKEESNQLANDADDKALEAEFVIDDNGVYQVLLKDVKSNKYLNDTFANGINLLKEKETLRSKVKMLARGASLPPDYASLDDRWLDNEVELGQVYTVNLAWFLNPENFYFQLQVKQKQFRDMMNEIQIAYEKRKPVSEPLNVGSSVIAVLPDDGVLYRAEIIELNKAKGHEVRYIDYGDRATVDPSKIYPVEKKFMVLPKQALFCGLKNIAPISGSNWSNATEIGKFFNAEKFDCIFHELQNDKYWISLNADGVDVGNALVQRGLAVFSSVSKHQTSDDVKGKTIQTQELPNIDINLLEGQTLHVKVSSVEGVSKFHVQFYTAKVCQKSIKSYISSNDPQVMPRLLSHEVCLGAGCLVNNKGQWRRGVVVNFTKSLYQISYIDTGEHEKVALDSMLKLPGQLSVMQNQAIECSLFDVPLSSKADDMLKSLINEKDVIIFVEKIERNRLIVRLFDMNGNKIKLIGSQNTEKISPICNLPILSSTHDVIVTNIKNSTCIWLQRSSDAPIEKQLLDDMYEHYSKVKVQAMGIENKLFAGCWTDGNWYRVLVLELKGSDEVKVQLVDYGDTGYILATDLRTLDPKFHLPYQLAVRVSLSVTLSGSNESQIELLEPMVKDKVLSATFYNVNRKWIAELSYNGEKLSDKLKALNVVKETTLRQLKQPPIQEMVVGERYKVMASHVDTPSQIWLQRKDEEEALYDLHDQMQEIAASCPDCEGIPEEKSMCLAMYSLDSCWYRAEVIDADADITTVRFVDYGNTDVVDNSASRVKKLADKWKAIKRYAIPCRLDVVSANAADDWPEEACARIKDLASPDNLLEALVLTDKPPVRVDLFLHGQSLCELLVTERLAIRANSSDRLDEALIEVVEEEQLDPRSAFVSHVVSVDEFWLQEEAKVKDLEMVADRLVMASIFPAVPKVERGLACVARYPEDNHYYRALVLSHDDTGTRVSYIDYGNSAVTEDIKVIPEDLAAIPPLSRRCRLAKPDGLEHWPKNVDRHFEKLAANGATVFILDVLAEGETFLVKLTHDSRDVAMELLEMCAQPESSCAVVHDANDIVMKERPAPIGEENISNQCRVCTVQSPAEFWIQKKVDFPRIDNLLERLSDSEKLTSAITKEEGKIMAMRYEDDPQCYRCKVLSSTAAGTEVFFIDYGTVAVSHSDTLLRELPDDVAHIPALAIRCSLIMPDGLHQWSEAACKKFNDLTADLCKEFRFEMFDGDNRGLTIAEQPLPVVLFYKDQNVAQLLVNTDQNLLCDKSLTDETIGPKDIPIGNSTIQPATAIPPYVEKDEKAHDNLMYQSKELSTVESESSFHESMDSKILPCQEEKIVPGSISRGLSIEEIARYSPVPPSAEDKIVPGSINKGDTLETGSVTSQDDDETRKILAASVEKKCESTEVLQLVSELQTICFDEKVVPSCISKGEAPFLMDRPTTPKTSHSEKLLAGAVNALSIADHENEKETLSIEVEKNISEPSV